MIRHNRWLLVTGLLFVGTCSSVGSASETDAAQILKATGVQGGLVVHVGCGDGRLTANLRLNDSFLVHGLDSDTAKVKQAQDHIQSRGLYGSVSVERWTKNYLPYTDNTVNLLLVSAEPCPVTREEIDRVLTPNGIALLQNDHLASIQYPASSIQHPTGTQNSSALAGWTTITKPWPNNIDQWTHFLRDASGNAVACDERVGSPRRIQWMAGPKRTRDHDATASMSAMTSSDGRVFYILDEGPTSLVHRPPKWKVIARDAFNGVLLWKREIPTWITHLWLFRSGPAQLLRRLVSVDDRVYVTLGLDAPVSMLDATTGETLLTYAGSENTEELIYHNDLLLTVLGDPNFMNDEAPQAYGYWELSVQREPTVEKSIAAYRAGTGELLWKKTGENLAYLAPLSLVAHEDRALFLDNENLRCIDLHSGDELWTAPFPTDGLYLRNYAPTVVAYDDVVMCLSWSRLCCFSVADGKLLWEQKGAIGFGAPGDLFAIDGLAWTVPLTSAIWNGNRLGRDGKIKTGIPIPKDNFLGNGGREIWGIDVHTGEVKRSLPRSEVLPGGHHHRCYRNKATERFLICGRRGLEYVDLVGDDHVNNWWLRGICQYGVMPANGYIYVPPDPCQCFNYIKLNWLHALSARNSLDEVEVAEGPAVEKGPAFAEVRVQRLEVRGQESGVKGQEADGSSDIPHAALRIPTSEDWPTFRGDMTRCGSTRSRVPTQLKQLWRADLGGELSAAVVADGRLLVSSKDRQTIHCLDANTGQPLWRFPTAGPVDSPPTLHDGLCVFGCGDGSVYCLRASDGQLVWRFSAAPLDRRVVANNRLESVWPIHGSVLIVDEVVYFAAGRSSYLDGGIRLYALELHSGQKMYDTTVSALPVYPGKPAPETQTKMTGALPDVLVSDGDRINMRQVQFDKRLVQLDKANLTTLFATTGLLEDTWAHRQNWKLGSSGTIDSHQHAGGFRDDGKTPSGKLIVFDGAAAYGVLSPYTWLKQTPSMHPPTHDGHYHQKYSRYKTEHFPIGTRIYAKVHTTEAAPAGKKKATRTPTTVSGTDGNWVMDQPFQPRAMALAADVLFLAGWLDAVAIQEQTGRALDPANPAPRRTVLRALLTADGRIVAEYPLECEPVFDGLIAARQCLYLALKDGSVLCLGGG